MLVAAAQYAAKKALVPHPVTPQNAWSAQVKVGGREVYFVGPAGRLRADAFQGQITEQIFRGLLALESPVNKLYVVTHHKVSCPWRVLVYDNVGANRRFLVIQGDGYAPLILKLQEGRVPRQLVLELQRIFHLREEKADGEADVDQERSLELRGGAVEPEAGKRPQHGKDARKRNGKVRGRRRKLGHGQEVTDPKPKRVFRKLGRPKKVRPEEVAG